MEGRRHRRVGGLRYAVRMHEKPDTTRGQRIAHVVVDIPARELDTHFDYLVPETIEPVVVGSCVLVDFANRPAVGYVLQLADSTPHERIKPIKALLAGPYFGPEGANVARWIADEYAAPLSEAVRLFTPPGGTPRLAKVALPGGESWTLRRAGVGPVDDRWAGLTQDVGAFEPKPNATMQRAVLDSLGQGPVRVPELSADLGAVDSTLKRLEDLGVVRIERRRRIREAGAEARPAPRPAHLTTGQTAALEAIDAVRPMGGVVLLDGVTGSGKTEVYLQAIEKTLGSGKTACVLVPEIALTPQTVGRFRTRFGDDIAVLHSRLSAGERFDQWDRVRSGDARIVVGARSALFAPLEKLGLIVIDEEHEPSYKQGSSPRYQTRDVAAQLAREHGAILVLGSATPSLETLEQCETGAWTSVRLPERVSGRPLPSVTIVDMGREFAEGHRSMFSRALIEQLATTVERGQKSVMFLNRRGFASFLLCRECGYVPQCDSCATSLTFHEVGSRLACHHCGAVRAVPVTCPRCGSPYLRKFGAGTQRVEAELLAQVPGVPIVRMDADTTKGKGGHERALAAFESIEGAGVLLGTQMIAKGLDYPDVTLVAVIDADTTLHLPDFRASERTYQLLEQVAGRGGRGDLPGHVVIQTYWPDHPALLAVAAHDPASFRTSEKLLRKELGYPPFGRLANLLVWGRDQGAVARSAQAMTDVVQSKVPSFWTLVGPSPAPLSRLKGNWRWHLLVKAPSDALMGPVLSEALCSLPRDANVSVTADVDPADLL